MAKFKVGDRIRANSKSDGEYWYTCEKMGWTGLVRSVAPDGMICAETLTGTRDHTPVVIGLLNEMYFDLITHACTEKIIITSDGKTTTARLVDGKNTVKTATAVCADSDTFDFQTGAKIAFERLTAEEKKLALEIKVGDKVKIRSWESMEKEFGLDRDGDIDCRPCFVRNMKKYCGKTVTVKHVTDDEDFHVEGDSDAWWFCKECVECIVTDEPSVKEVHRQATVGEYVKLLTSGGYDNAYTIGKVYKVEKEYILPHLISDNGKHLLSFLPHEYVVLEGYKPDGDAKTESKAPEYLNGKVVCIKSGYSWWTVGKVYDVVDGKITADDGYIYPRKGGEPYRDFEDVRHAGCIERGHRHNPENEFIEFKGEAK